jgi:hypothetical protein
LLRHLAVCGSVDEPGHNDSNCKKEIYHVIT